MHHVRASMFQASYMFLWSLSTCLRITSASLRVSSFLFSFPFSLTRFSLTSYCVVRSVVTLHAASTLWQTDFTNDALLQNIRSGCIASVMGLSQCGTASCDFKLQFRFIEHVQSRAQSHDFHSPPDPLKVSPVTDSETGQMLTLKSSTTLNASK